MRAGERGGMLTALLLRLKVQACVQVLFAASQCSPACCVQRGCYKGQLGAGKNSVMRIINLLREQRACVEPPWVSQPKRKAGHFILVTNTHKVSGHDEYMSPCCSLSALCKWLPSLSVSACSCLRLWLWLWLWLPARFVFELNRLCCCCRLPLFVLAGQVSKKLRPLPAPLALQLLYTPAQQ